MVGPYVERDGDEPEIPSPPSVSKPAPPENRRGIMEDYIYYATPPRVGSEYKVAEYNGAPQEVIRGGFPQNEADRVKTPPNCFRCFPPPPNAAYELDSHCRLPRLQ